MLTEKDAFAWPDQSVQVGILPDLPRRGTALEGAARIGYPVTVRRQPGGS